MFKCRACELLHEEVKHLRETNQKLTDQLIAISSPQAYGALQSGPFNPDNYYGNDGDEFVEFDQFGQKVLVKRDPIAKS